MKQKPDHLSNIIYSQSLAKEPCKALGKGPLSMNGALCHPLKTVKTEPSLYATPQTKAVANRGQNCSYFQK